jgi:RNA polymerase sigma-70 factor, ECF subfamily
VADLAYVLPCPVPTLSEAETVDLSCLRRFSRRLVPMIEAEAELQSQPREQSAPPAQAEQACLYRVARGDRAALSQLYTTFAPMMMGLAERIMRDPKEAEDLIHDVFVEAWRRAGDYDPTRSSVKAWLLMMVRSRALDRLRSARAKQITLVAVVPEVEAVTNDSELCERGQLHVALSRLTPEQRSVLELGYFQGLSSQEIASALGVPLGTVKSRVAAALGHLRVMLGHSGESTGKS